jgi:lipopolysaccharide transport system ATP-binding protein
MSDVVIRANGLGKRYLIGHESERERYVALRDVIARGARNLVRSAGDMMRGRQIIVGDEIEEFWALKDIDFEIRRGDVVGIIGRNGAGKSTLLKVLSRITEPTVGRVEIRGRIASLLEVGTGFHPELTGRENIFLNGAILGMARAEIRRKFDEIVAFAEVEKFLDTPVKRYSSGMYVRLAFAVAAHLEPEILIVDEVLAVGDAEFQKKCLGKMKDVAGGGRTVLFVSHNMGAVERLCSRGMLLEGGSVKLQSDAVEKCVSAYADAGSSHMSSVWVNGGSEYGNDVFIPESLALIGKDGERQAEATYEEGCTIELRGTLLVEDSRFTVAIVVYRADGERLFWSSVHDAATTMQTLVPGKLSFRAHIPPRLLNEGSHEIELIAFLHNRRYVIEPGSGPRISFESAIRYSSPYWDRHRDGMIAPQIPWTIEHSAGD